MTIFGMDIEIVAIKAVFFIVVVAITVVVSHFATKATRKLLNKFDKIPSISLIVNIVRAIIWTLALIIVLEPVFGIQPTAFVTGLGVTSVVISLGLKDTIANIIGGFNLMFTNVISIGDDVTISGITGTVSDISWRHTVVVNRLGNKVVIPNSVLNTTAIIRLSEKSEALCKVPFTLEPGHDTAVVTEEILERVNHADEANIRQDEGFSPVVLLDGITPNGITGNVCCYVKEGVPTSGVQDKIVRSLADLDYFSVIPLA